jgi:phosphatidylserine/phosphatidylglycerophosphate/cardiolipin synthase-like enzyme
MAGCTQGDDPARLAAQATRAAPSASAVAPAMRLPAGARSVQLYVEPHDGKRIVTRAILRARHSILLEMYLLTDHVVLHDIEHAAAKGVAVQVILERQPYTTGDNPNMYAYDNLMAAEIPTRWSSPAFALTHAKVMVVDGRTAYIMTTNYTRAAFRSNREFVVRDDEAPDVRQAEEVFRADWAGHALRARDAQVPISPNDARPLLGALVSSAHATLDIFAEEFQDPAMAQLLAQRARHGVHVRVLLPALSTTGYDADAQGVAVLRRAGGEVRRVGPRALYIHAKAIIADGREAFVGSENLSAASLDRNREVGVFIAAHAAIARLEMTFGQDWQNAGAQALVSR